jgi:dihydrolipoamide dehydrogenase
MKSNGFMYDLLVIGSGPGGYVAAIRGAQLGMKTASVERADVGGICLNWGCIPTKALLKSAQALYMAQHAADYGVTIESAVKPDLEKMVARSRAVASGMSRGVEYLLKKNDIALLQGSGCLQSDRSVEITADDDSQQRVTAKHIILAAGARANTLPFAPIDGDKIIGYRQALTPETIPPSMAVIGSGAIGSELAWFYHSLGTQVYLIETLDNIVPLEDEDVSAQLSRSFRKAGIKVMAGTLLQKIDTSGESCTLQLKTKKGEETLQVALVLSAVGIVPNTEGLGLHNLSIDTERGRIKVDEHFQTCAEGVYAIGDVIATPALAHVASAEAIYCVEHLAGLPAKPINYHNIPSCIYTTPEIASVGFTESAARAKGFELKIGKFPFTASGKAAAAGEKDGFVKLIFDAGTDALLGAHLIGANVSEMIAGIVTARNLGVKGTDIIRSIHPHPSMSEAIMEAAAAAHGEAIHL